MSNQQPSIPKVIYNNINNIKVAYDQETGNINLLSASYFPALTTGGWGDPHMFLRIKGTDKFLCKWGDNKSGESGKNEILYLYMRTSRETIRIYYTNETYTPNGAKITTNIRVVYNDTTYNISQNFIGFFGPVRLSVRRISYGGSNYYLNYDMDWDPIPNLRQIGGAFGIVLKRSLLANGVFVNGGDGRLWDGYGVLGQPLGLSRFDFESGNQSQSVKAMNFVPGNIGEDLSQFLNGEINIPSPALNTSLALITNTDSLATDVVAELGQFDEGKGVGEWDDLTPDAEVPYATLGSLNNVLITRFVTDNEPIACVFANRGIQTDFPADLAQKTYDILQANPRSSDNPVDISTDSVNPQILISLPIVAPYDAAIASFSQIIP
jgi:hypothetical protein